MISLFLQLKQKLQGIKQIWFQVTVFFIVQDSISAITLSPVTPRIH